MGQLERTPDSVCPGSLCPGESIQYECGVSNSGSGIVWQIPGCLARDIVNTADGMCVDGAAVVVARGSVIGSSFVSHLDVNITGQLDTLTVNCIFDDGSSTQLVDNDTLTSPIGRSLIMCACIM